MKTKKSALLAGLLLVSGTWFMQPLLADDAHHPDQKKIAANPDQTIQIMQSNTKRMQSQLDKLAKSKDPKERQKLMQEHMKTMQENANMAQGMMMGSQQDGCPMMGGGMGMMGKGGMGMMGGGGMGQGAGGMGGDAMMNRMQMMEKRMDMMQMMMEQMNKSTGMPTSK